MSLPFSQARRASQPEAPPTATKVPPGRNTPARLSTSHSSNRPISTSSRGYSITSKNSLPEKQLLSRYRHVYAGKGGWFQGRTSFAPPANYSSGSNSRHLDVYRKELIMRLSKDIFENSKQKIASADVVVSNKVAGDPDGETHNVTTKLGEHTTKTMTSVEIQSPTPSPRPHRRDSATNSRMPSSSQRQQKPTFHSFGSSRYREQSASTKNPIKINLRGGSTRMEPNTQPRLNATAAAGYRSNSVKNTRGIDNMSSSRTEANQITGNTRDVLSLGADPHTDPTVAEQKKSSDNDPESDYLFSSFKRSNTIHGDSFKKRNTVNNPIESKPEEPISCEESNGNEAERINDEKNETYQNNRHLHKSTEGSQSKCLSKEVEEKVSVVHGYKQENNKGHGSVKRSLENNPQDKAGVNTPASKPAKRGKISGKQPRSEDKYLDSILGEIQFNVLRQRSFIRLPKKVAKVLANERPVTRGENGEEPRQLLSRMSLSKEARDALQETRKEMKLETTIDLDKYDLRKLNSRGNKRPNTPKPESPKDDVSSKDSGTSSFTPEGALNSHLKSTPRLNGRARTSADKSFDELDTAAPKMKESVAKVGGKKKLVIPTIQYTVDSSREKFNQTVENGMPPKPGSRASTVATPITDLVSALPKQQQDRFMRYSTHMSRDTPRTSQRNTADKNRRLTVANTPATRTQLLNVPGENKNGVSQSKKVKNSYTVPLKVSSEETGESSKPVVNGLPPEVASIKSDWESQLRAMSKYGLVTEKSFQITPPGWDERYKDLANKNNGKETEKDTETMAQVKEKAIEKCSDWLQKYS